MDIQDSIEFDGRWEACEDYTVFVDGVQAIDYYTSERHAQKVAQVWRDAGHDDVQVVDTWTIED